MTASAGGPILSLSKIRKSFGTHLVVDGLNLHVEEGEFFTLLGPSGCGKTTALRQIAGLEYPDAGEIRQRERVLAAPARKIFVPPNKRGMGMVFQSYAIWPHLTVAENVAYPLKARRVKRDEVHARVGAALEMVGLAGLQGRSASALSGGQQQRVALARALVYRPEVLLLDEPFSNLDVKLREQMRIELKTLQRRLNVTVILVTHDQAEALSLSDTVAVMRDGRIDQVGPPAELYDRPATPFVRDFVGTSVTVRVLIEDLHGSEADFSVEGWPGDRFTTPNCFLPYTEPRSTAWMAVRPERVVVEPSPRPSRNTVTGVIETLLFVGDKHEAQVRVGGSTIQAHLPKSRQWTEGEEIVLHFPPEAISLWPS